MPPLPPPNQPETRYVSEGLLLVEGKVPAPQARVVLLNVDTARLAGQLITEHRYDFLISAQPGHRLELWYEVGRERSDPILFVAPPHDWEATSQPGDAQAPDAQAPDAPSQPGDAQAPDAQAPDAPSQPGDAQAPDAQVSDAPSQPGDAQRQSGDAAARLDAGAEVETAP